MYWIIFFLGLSAGAFFTLLVFVLSRMALEKERQSRIIFSHFREKRIKEIECG